MKKNWKKLSALLVVLALCMAMVPMVSAANVASSTHNVTLSLESATAGPLTRGQSFSYIIKMTALDDDYAVDITGLDLVIPLVGCSYSSFTAGAGITTNSLVSSATLDGTTLRIAVRGNGSSSQKIAWTENEAVIGTVTFTAGADLPHGATVSANVSGGFHKQNTDAYYVLDQVNYATTINYAFTLDVTEPTHGTLSTDPAAGSVGVGTEVTVTSAPAAGYQGAYTVTGATSGTITPVNDKFNMPAENVTVAATYTPIASEITYALGANESLTIDATTYTNANDTAPKTAYTIESEAFMLPAPTTTEENKTFAGWQAVNTVGNWTAGDVVRPGATVSGKYGNVIMSAIWIDTPTLTLNSADHATVTLSTPASDDGVIPIRSIAEAGNNTVKEGTTVTVNITPDAGYSIASVAYNAGAGDVTIPNAPYTFSMPSANTAVTVTMVADNFAITKTAENGTVSAKVGGEEAATAHVGDVVTVTATPNTGYELSSLTYSTDGSTSNPIASGGTFTMAAHDASVNAVFSPISYTITFQNQAGTAIGTKTYTVTTGGTLEGLRTAAAAVNIPTIAGYTFSQWEVITEDGNWDETYYADNETLVGKNGNVTLKANYSWTPTIVTTDYKYAGSGNVLLLVGDVGDLGSGNALKYNGNAMFTTTDEYYQAKAGVTGTVYCYIIPSSAAATVQENLTKASGTNHAIDRDGDVDGNDVLNSNDWGLVNDILANTSAEFINSMSVRARLECDVATGAWAAGTAFGTIEDVSGIMSKYLAGTAVTAG